jgi:hypothetical protein
VVNNLILDSNSNNHSNLLLVNNQILGLMVLLKYKIIHLVVINKFQINYNQLQQINSNNQQDNLTINNQVTMLGSQWVTLEQANLRKFNRGIKIKEQIHSSQLDQCSKQRGAIDLNYFCLIIIY